MARSPNGGCRTTSPSSTAFRTPQPERSLRPPCAISSRATVSPTRPPELPGPSRSPQRFQSVFGGDLGRPGVTLTIVNVIPGSLAAILERPPTKGQLEPAPGLPSVRPVPTQN